MTFPDNFDQMGQYVYNDMKHRLQKRLCNLQTFLDPILKKNYNLYKQNNNSDISYSEYVEQFRKKLEENQKSEDNPKNMHNNNSNFSNLLFLLQSMKPC